MSLHSARRRLQLTSRSSPRSISGVLPSSGSAVRLPKLHYTTVHAALKDITLSETDVSAAALLFVWFSAVKYKRSEYDKLFLLSQVEEDFLEEELGRSVERHIL